MSKRKKITLGTHPVPGVLFPDPDPSKSMYFQYILLEIG